MLGKRWLKRVSVIVILSILVQMISAPLTVWVLERAMVSLDEMASVFGEARTLREGLGAMDRAVAPRAMASPWSHDPGDTASEGNPGDGGGPCDEGESGCSKVQYHNRSLISTLTLGSAGLPVNIVHNSRYELAPAVLAAWLPTKTAVDNWRIDIQGWAFEGKGAHALAFWDTSDRQTGQPVPAGVHFFEATFSNKLGVGSTSHPVIVKRAHDGPLGYNWAHGYMVQLTVVDEMTVLVESYGSVSLFLKEKKGKDRYVAQIPREGEVVRQADGTWQWIRNGSDGSLLKTVATFDARGRAVRLEDRAGVVVQLTYDEQSRLAQIVDGSGYQTTFTYDGPHIVGVTDAAGARWTLGYQDGNLARVTDPLGQVWSYAYDAAHRMVSKTDPRGNVTRYAYDDVGGITSVTDSAGNVIGFETKYNTAPLLAENPSAVPPVLGTTTVAYRTADGTETSRRTYDFNGYNQVTRKVSSPDGGTTQYVWQYNWGRGDAQGQLLSEVNPQGQATQYEYQSGTLLVTRVQSPGKPGLRLSYKSSDELGWLLSSYAQEGLALVRLGYTDRGNLNHFQFGDLEYWLTYAPVGRGERELPVAVIYNWDGKSDLASSPASSVVQLQWDERGQLVGLTDQLGRHRALEYDAAGRLVRVSDSLGRATSYEYDGVGQLVSQTDAAGGVTRYAHDETGNLLEVTDARGGKMAFGYNHKGRPEWRKDALGRVKRWGYDNEGRPIWREEPTGSRVEFAYDDLGRKTAMSFPSGQTWRATYDQLNQLTSASSGDVVWAFDYDEGGRPTKATVNRPGHAVSVTYGYGADGLLKKLQTSAGLSLAYDYGRHGELTRIDSPLGDIRLNYATRGQIVPLLTEIKADQLATHFTYDKSGRLTRLVYIHPKYSGQPLSYDYAYDDADNVVAVTEAGGTTSYKYDGLDQLAGVTRPGGTAATYTYDAVGNRLRATLGTASTDYVYDAANQLVRAGPIEYSYDASGYLVGAWDGRRATRYTWDDGGQLASAPAPQMSGFLSDFERFSGVERLLRSSDAGEYELIDSLLQKDSGIGLDFFGVQQPGVDQMAHWKQLASVAERESDKNPFLADTGTEAQGWNLLSQYGYDVFGQPDSRQVPPSSVTEYLTDRGHTIQQLDGQGKSAGDAVYGAGWDTLLAWRPGEGGQPLYPVRDAMDTVNSAVTHDGSLEDSAAYDPWGKPTRPDASSPLPGFQGRPYESSTGLYQLRARYYSPELGRFISPDPAVDPLRPKTLNGYAFGFNNPLRYGDPTGLFSWKKAAAWAGVAICSAVLVGALALTAPVWFPAFAITAAVLFGSSLLLGTAYFNFNPPGC